MNISALRGYLVFGRPTGASSRFTSVTGSSARARADDDAALQRFGLFLRDFRGVIENTQRVIGSAYHSPRLGKIKLTGTKVLALSPTATAAVLRSSRVIGGTPSSFTPGNPAWTTAARSQPTLGGTYNGSNGDQTLTLRAVQGGLVGRDDLVFDVIDGSANQLEQLNVAGDYSAGDDITLANGLTMQLSAGVVNAGAEMTVAVTYSSTETSSSYSPVEPSWTVEPRPAATIGGTYDGSNGTQRLTLSAASSGTIGVDDMTIDVRDQDGGLVEQLNVAATYSPGDAITLANGMTVALSAGYLSAGDAFGIDVAYSAGTPQRAFTPTEPAWASGSDALPTIGGAYNGSNGSQSLTFRVSSEGEVGASAVTLDVLDGGGELLQQVEVAADYVPGSEITLANGLTLSLGAGMALAGDEFSVAVSETPGTPESLYTPVGPDWITAARPGATMGGTYDGSNGSQQLTLRVSGGGVVGSSEIGLDVLDGEGAVLTHLTVAADYVPGDPLALANGLTLSLAAGTLGAGDEFALDVSYTAGSVQSSATPDTSAWETSSVPAATIDGIYDESNGSQSLTLRIAQGGTIGTDQVLIDVLDDQGSVLEQLTVASDYVPGVELSLANGLTLSLASGRLVEGDAITVAVNVSIPLDPDAAFDGGDGDPPSYLLGATVTDGTFELNGVQIDVYAGDSLTTVLARINEAGAGATTGLDGNTGRIVFTQTTPGADGDIQVANDTSGFLAAVGLDSGTLVAGSDGDFASTLDQVSALAGVSNGTLLVNGRSIALDVDSDTVEGMIAKLGAAGVTLAYNATSQRFELRGTGNLTLDDGVTGFFAKLGLETGEYANVSRKHGFGNPDEVARGLRDFANAWNRAPAADAADTVGAQAGRLNAALRPALQSYFTAAGLSGDSRTLRTSFGMTFQFGSDGAMEITLDQDALEAAVRSDAQHIQDFLVGKSDMGGLFAVLEATMRPTNVAVNSVLKVRGLSALDVYA